MDESEKKKIGGPPALDRVYVEFEYLRQKVDKLTVMVGGLADAVNSMSEFIVEREKRG